MACFSSMKGTKMSSIGVIAWIYYGWWMGNVLGVHRHGTYPMNSLLMEVERGSDDCGGAVSRSHCAVP